jgi:hypothetical protein
VPKINVSINTAAKAVMPNGKLLSRRDVLAQLGLNPSTPPDAWLAVVACGSNASGLHLPDAQQLLDRGKITTRVLDKRVLNKIRPG